MLQRGDPVRAVTRNGGADSRSGFNIIVVPAKAGNHNHRRVVFVGYGRSLTSLSQT